MAIVTENKIPVLIERTYEVDGSVRHIGKSVLQPNKPPIRLIIIETSDQLVAYEERCPHQGQSLADAELTSDNLLRCRSHGSHFPLFGEKGLGFEVVQEGNQYFVHTKSKGTLKSIASRETVRPSELEREIEALRAANQTQQENILVGLNQMDTILSEVEAAKQEIDGQAKKLSSLNELMSRINNNLGEGLVVSDPRGNITYVNPKALKDLGCDEKHLLGESLDKLLNPKDLQALTKKFEIPLNTSRPLLYEAVYKTVDFEEEIALVHHGKTENRKVFLHLVRGTILYSEQGKEEGLILLAGDISNLKRREVLRRQRDTEANLRQVQAALSNLGQGVAVFSQTRQLEYWNTAHFEIMDYPQDWAKQGTHFLDFLKHDLFLSGVTADQMTLRSNEATRKIFKNNKWTGEITCDGDRTIELEINPMPGGGFIRVSRDITERRNSEEKIRQLSYAVEQSPTEIVITDTEGLITYVNPVFTENTGFTLQEALGMKSNLVYSGKMTKEFYVDLWDTIKSGKRWHGEIINKKKNGEEIWQLMAISPMRDERGDITHFLAVKEDITSQKKAEENLKYLANHDSLTGLPNRLLFYSRLDQSIERAKEKGSQSALLFFDLDHFKDVNDTLGHDIGDELLKAVASRISSCLRDGDSLARLGGDEFAIIQGDVENSASCTKLAKRVHEAVSSPFRVERNLIHSGASIGIAMIPEDGETSEELLKNADVAMYQAKAARDGREQFYNKEMHSGVERRRKIEDALRGAITNQELTLVYQPKYGTQDGELTGAEALIRWYHPDLGQVSPMEFIPIAEQTGQIIEIGDWVLEMACQQITKWSKRCSLPSIAVNLSAVQLKQVDLDQRIMEILAKQNVSTSQIELEITETAAIADISASTIILEKLAHLGLKSSLDDFGVGFSSLSHLTSLPVDKIKIDRSFIQHIDDNTKASNVAEAIIRMGQVLKRPTIAEGVETEAQLKLLQSWGCNEVQGYYFSKPLLADEFEKILK